MKLIKLMFSGPNRWRLLALPLLAVVVIIASGVFSDTTALILLALGIPISTALLVLNRKQERRNRFYR